MRKTGFIISMALSIVFLSCKDVPVTPAPGPTGPGEIRVVLNGLGSAQPGDNELYAIVSMEDEYNAEVMSNKRLAVMFAGKHFIEPVELGAGKYKLSKLLVVNGAGKIRYAAPLTNSAKSQQVQKPLSLAVELAQAEHKDLPVEVLNVAIADKPEHFGYPEGSFGTLNNESYVSVKLQALLTIGNINYDSIPANFTITSWNGEGQKFEKDTLLLAGAKEVLLPSSHVLFKFLLRKWGITEEMTLTREQLTEGTTYVLGGSKQARKLKQEETLLYVNGAYKPDSRTIYKYDGGRLKLVEFYQKLPDFEELMMTNWDVYYYDANKVERIDRFDDAAIKVGFTQFSYNVQGTRIDNIHQKSYDQETGAAVSYSYPPGRVQISTDYVFSNGNTMTYKMIYKGGNKISDLATTSTGGRESGEYRYDFFINPFAHMNMPSLYQANMSKNNLIDQQKAYNGGYPVAVPVEFLYTYDEEGYPTQLIRTYNGYLTGTYLYKTKTVYTYQ